MNSAVLTWIIIGVFGGGCFNLGRWWELRHARLERERRRNRKLEMLAQMQKDYMARAERLRDDLNSGKATIDEVV